MASFPAFLKFIFFFLKALIICNVKYLYSRLPFFFFFLSCEPAGRLIFHSLYILKVHVLIGVIGRLPSQRKGDTQIFCVPLAKVQKGLKG